MKRPYHSRRTFLFSLVIILAAAIWFSSSPSQSQTQPGTNRVPKYVFLFLSDGAGMTHLEVARQYSRQIYNEAFVIVDKIVKEGVLGVMTTHAADSLSTD